MSDSVSKLVLVEDGRPAAVIVTGDSPCPSQKMAAEELQYHLKRISGAELSILRESELRDLPGTRILVGQSNLLRSLGIDTTKLKRETLIVKTGDGTLILAGEDGGQVDPNTVEFCDVAVRTGTLYAVYDFLQDQLGCRWLWPGKTGEIIPKRKTVAVGALSIQETPKLFMRHFRPGIRERSKDPGEDHYPRYAEFLRPLFDPMRIEEQTWLKRMKMGRSELIVYGHAFTDWYDRFFETDSDVFAEQADGSRGLPNPSYPKEFVKLCVSNPRAIEIAIEDFMTKRKTDPGFRWMNACENDGGLGFCQCKNCREWDKGPGEDQLENAGLDGSEIDGTLGVSSDGLPNSLSYRYFRFYNKLARRLREVAPDAYVVTYGYSRYRNAPAGMKLEPNIMVGLIGFNTYPMTAEQIAQQRANYMAWRKTGVEKMFFRPNSFFFSPAHGIPWDAAVQMGEDILFLVENGTVSTDFDSLNGHWSTASPTYYTTARLHWDLHLKADEAWREFVDAFGPAAEAVGYYFLHWRKAFEDAYLRPDIDVLSKQADPIGGWLGLRKVVGMLFGKELFDKGRELLKKARNAAAGNEDVLKSLRVLQIGLDHGERMIQAARFSVARKPDQPVRFEEHWPVVREIMKRREELARLHAHNVFWLDAFEIRMHDMYGLRVYYDFYKQPYAPLMTPGEGEWAFLPDPEDQGESEGWFAKKIEVPEALRHSPYQHIYYTTWDATPPMIGWKRTSGNALVRHGWYQATFAPSNEDVHPGNVLYLPYVRGSAKVWIDGKLVREIGAGEGAGGKAVVLDIAELGVQAEKPFVVTVKVSSPDRPGGLIGPVYLARPEAG
jgi:hypothetical protein